MGLDELMRRVELATREGGASGSLYDWACHACRADVLVIDDSDDDPPVDDSYNVKRALLPLTASRRTARPPLSNAGASTSRAAAAENVSARAPGSAASTVDTSTSTSTSAASNVGASPGSNVPPPTASKDVAGARSAAGAFTFKSTSHDGAFASSASLATPASDVQTPLSPPPSRSPSLVDMSTVPVVDFSRRRKRADPERPERARKKARLARTDARPPVSASSQY